MGRKREKEGRESKGQPVETLVGDEEISHSRFQ